MYDLGYPERLNPKPESLNPKTFQPCISQVQSVLRSIKQVLGGSRFLKGLGNLGSK